ncbi:MAG: CubicO group peptidase (beta-lactamase class C family), partial [Phenylobacterium sp.]
MTSPLKILLFGFALICSGAANATNTSTNTTTESKDNIHHQIDRVIKPYVEHQVFSGVVLVAKQGKVVYQQGFGLANREWGQFNTPQVKFRIASVSKTFTAALVLKLVEQNKLNLNDTIDQYLPDFPKDKASKITVEHLLAHRSGLPRAFVMPGWFKGRFNGEVSDQEFAEQIASLALKFAPGSSRSYTNLGYFLLGMMVESATGQSFEKALQQHILSPLNLSNTGIAHYNAVLKNRAAGYQIESGGGYKHPNYQNIAMFGAGAALYSTVGDLYQWDQLLYASKKGNQLLTEPNRQRLFSYAWHGQTAPLAGSDKPISSLRADGETPGFAALMTRFADEGNSIIILSNNEINNVEKNRLTDDIAAVLYDVPAQASRLPVSFLFTRALVKGELDKVVEEYQRTAQKHKGLYALDEAGVN